MNWLSFEIEEVWSGMGDGLVRDGLVMYVCFGGGGGGKASWRTNSMLDSWLRGQELESARWHTFNSQLIFLLVMWVP